ncbi:DUF6440 family protein [Bacillus thuringiensis]|uniref:DUF6440 family protein n=1 Tax=Bacillus thuringiensis TaxID=1428 RepID=UPI000BF87BD8|nr:DUF6440 family protein [Bacillus thuringiensis]PES54472.1 hypothetical protein CN506_20565 [Bacillus thuringiensis]
MRKLISVLLCCSILAACGSEEGDKKEDNRLLEGQKGRALYVVTDKETGCQYFTNANDWSSEGMTLKVRLRSDGQPMCPDVKAKDDTNDKQKNG